jgi:hypothetical protein
MSIVAVVINVGVRDLINLGTVKDGPTGGYLTLFIHLETGAPRHGTDVATRSIHGAAGYATSVALVATTHISHT